MYKGRLRCDAFISENKRLMNIRRSRCKVLTPEYRKERDQLNQCLSEIDPSPDPVGTSLVSLSLDFYLNHRFSVRDVDNLLKGVVDVIAPYYGFNDKQIIEYHVRKFKSDKEYEEVRYKICECSLVKSQRSTRITYI